MGIQRRLSRSSCGSSKPDRASRLAGNSNDLADISMNSVCSNRTTDSVREAQARLDELMDCSIGSDMTVKEERGAELADCSIGSDMTVKEERGAELAVYFDQCHLGDPRLAANSAQVQAAIQQAAPVAGVTPAALPPQTTAGHGLPALIPTGVYAAVPTGQMISPCLGHSAMACTNQAFVSVPDAAGSSGQSSSISASTGKVRRTVHKNRNVTTRSSPPRAPALVTDGQWQKRYEKRGHSLKKFKSSPIYYTFEDHSYASKNWPTEPNPHDQTLRKRPWEREVAKWRALWRRINAVCQLMAKSYKEKACEEVWSRLENTDVEQQDSEEHDTFQERKHNERVAQAEAMLLSHEMSVWRRQKAGEPGSA